MKTLRDPKRWLIIGALALLTPVFSLAQHAEKPTKGCSSWDTRKCQQVPDGGSTAGYLLAVGATCIGAMVLRSRSRKARLL
jgi:hypothetical protein